MILGRIRSIALSLRSHPRGFVLPVVLLLLATIAAIATRLSSAGVAGRERVAAEIVRTQERLALESAIDIALEAIRRRDPVLTERLSDSRNPLSLTIGGVPTETRLVAESGKVDLNAAPIALIAATMEIVLGLESGRLAADETRRRRSEGRPFLSEVDVLPKDARFGLQAAAVTEAFTVATGSPGVVVVSAPRSVRRALSVLSGRVDASDPRDEMMLDGISEFIAAGRPVYSLLAICSEGGRSLFVTFRKVPETGVVTVMRRRFQAAGSGQY